jgi:hypothetical protein
MNASISQELVGFQVSIEMRKMTVEGLVRHIDPTGSKLSLTNAVVLSSDVKLPPLYHIFIKDVINSELFYKEKIVGSVKSCLKI